MHETFEPDYYTPCEVCGQTPTVVVHKNGQEVHHTDLCGVCCFGEAECLYPENW